VPPTKAQSEATGIRLGEDFTRAFEAARAEKVRKAEADRAYNERKLEYQTDKEFKQAQIDLQRKRADVQNQVEGLQLQREHMALDQATQAAADAPLLMDATQQFAKAKNVDEVRAIPVPKFASPQSIAQFEKMQNQAIDQVLNTSMAKGQQDFNTNFKTVVSKLDAPAQAELMSVLDPQKPFYAQSPDVFSKLTELGRASNDRSLKSAIKKINAEGKVRIEEAKVKNEAITDRKQMADYEKLYGDWYKGYDSMLKQEMKALPPSKINDPKFMSEFEDRFNAQYQKNHPKPTLMPSKNSNLPYGLKSDRLNLFSVPEGQTDGDGQDDENE
jgi:hypothetical protein